MGVGEVGPEGGGEGGELEVFAFLGPVAEELPEPAVVEVVGDGLCMCVCVCV